MRARAIVMPLAGRNGAGPLFSKNLETVLAERPCRIIIESLPAAQRARDGRVSGAGVGAAR
jgi:basic amino acid/polyamine antiporter, APA family